MRHGYTLFKRAGTKTWYFYFQDEETGKRIGKSTRQATKYNAERYAENFLDAKDHPKSGVRLKDFTKDFFIWDRCGWVKRQHAKGRSFSQPVADFRRGRLLNYIAQLLKNMGFTYQKAKFGSDHKDPEKRKEWLEKSPRVRGLYVNSVYCFTSLRP